MESLGFADTTSTWSDSPNLVRAPQRPVETTPASTSASITDWEPNGLGDRLGGSNVRWGVLATALVILAGAVGLGLWLVQRPQVKATTAMANVNAHANALSTALPALDELGNALASQAENLTDIDITPVGETARRLFDAGGSLPASESEARFLATGAASAALDGVRLAEEARAYTLAVAPILSPPELETDPAVIELDEAARSFGAWQLRFDDIRTALPDSVLPTVTEQFDVLSGDLAGLLNRYVDALRSDVEAAVDAVVAELGDRLEEIRQSLDTAIATTRDRVGDRVAEAQAALADLLGG